MSEVGAGDGGVSLVVPDLGMGGARMTVSVWLVRRGAEVTEGDRLVEILVGAATVDLPAPTSGRLARKLVEEDDEVRVGEVLGIVEPSDGPGPG